MTWSKYRSPIPRGFTDFQWKKNRFISNYDNNKYKQNVYQVYDTRTTDRWFINYNCNNINNDDLGVILNNLYERNGYLRRECSKQTFLAKHYKKDADFWRKLYYNMAKERDIKKQEGDHWYNLYIMLKTKKEKQKADWKKIKEM